MPELPEVQTVVNDLNAADLIGIRINAARVFWPRTIAEPSPELFCRWMKGQKISEIKRRGKYLVFEIADGNTLLLQLIKHIPEFTARNGINTSCRLIQYQHFRLMD